MSSARLGNMRRLISTEVKSSALADYAAGEKTVDRICAEYGIGRRTLYQWLEKDGKTDRVRNYGQRKSLRVNREEAELLLLMILECDSLLNTDQRTMALSIEERLLEIADDLSLSA